MLFFNHQKSSFKIFQNKISSFNQPSHAEVFIEIKNFNFLYIKIKKDNIKKRLFSQLVIN